MINKLVKDIISSWWWSTHTELQTFKIFILAYGE